MNNLIQSWTRFACTSGL